MAMPLLPSLPMLPMAIAIPLLPTEWLWGCRCCRWRVGDGVAMAMTLLPMAIVMTMPMPLLPSLQTAR